jgi:hypothetical protein
MALSCFCLLLACLDDIQFRAHFLFEGCSKVRNNLFDIGYFMALVLASDTSQYNNPEMMLLRFNI